MSELPKEYQICKIKIKPKKFKIKKSISKKRIIITKKSDNILVNINSEDSFIYNTIKEKSINNSELKYIDHYITITLCYNFKIYNKPIKSLSNSYLIGTNVLSFMGNSIPVFKTNNIGNKKLVREKSKDLWQIKNKYIHSIKHINNYKNFHNYLVLLDVNNKSLNKFIKKFKNSSYNIQPVYCWKTYLGIYNPTILKPSNSLVYNTLSTTVLSYFNLKFKDNDNYSILIKHIYKTISLCIGDEPY